MVARPRSASLQHNKPRNPRFRIACPTAFYHLLLGSFAFSAVLLAMIGLFGVLSYLVGLREQEIGVRMALGADRGMILKWMLRKGFALGLAGCVFGLLLATLSTKLLQTSCIIVSRFDPLTLIGVPCLLLIIVWWPCLFQRAVRHRLIPCRLCDRNSAGAYSVLDCYISIAGAYQKVVCLRHSACRAAHGLRSRHCC